MAAPDRYVLETTIVEEHVVFTLADLCRASGAEPQQLLAMVEVGLLDPTGQGPEQWRFGGRSLPTARTALRLSQDLDLALAGVALVMDLLAEIEALRARLRRAGL